MNGDEEMVTITLVGEKQAKEGNEFIYNGPLAECRDCKLKQVCFNLEPGKRYIITKVRDAPKHECRIHDGCARVVEVERSQVKIVVNSKNAIEGAMFSFEPKPCMNLGCEFYITCNPQGVKKEDKFKVAKIIRDIKCPDGDMLKEVLLSDE